MPVDMKQYIADAAERLIEEKRAKKLTVTDIVEECAITRQTFYYHFEDIPDLINWMLKQEFEKAAREINRSGGNLEYAMRRFLETAMSKEVVM